MRLSCLFHGLCAPLRSGHFLIRISSWPLDGWHWALGEVLSVMS